MHIFACLFPTKLKSVYEFGLSVCPCVCPSISLTLSNKVYKCLCIWFVCLSVRVSVRLPVHALILVNILQDVLKLKNIIHIRHSMNRIENGKYTANTFSTALSALI